MRDSLKHFVESNPFQYTVVALIVINAIILGMETSDTLMDQYGVYLKTIDGVILKIFIVEILLRIYVYRVEFFKRPWSLFDLAIVMIALIPSGGVYSSLRALRVLRVFRMISIIPAMRKVIEGLFYAIPGIASVLTIMLLFFYVFSVIGTHLYSDTFPDWFGDLGKTMYTLFQIMTLESWSMGIVRPVMEQHPTAWLFFVIYILVTTFTMLNLFIAIMVNAIHQGADEEAKESRNEIKDELIKEIHAVEQRLMDELKKQN
ncbi:MAG: ion transporter [Rickettsiales bacterium]|nr:ion transporter [Rickettsiales bacterium]